MVSAQSLQPATRASFASQSPVAVEHVTEHSEMRLYPFGGPLPHSIYTLKGIEDHVSDAGMSQFLRKMSIATII